MTPRTPSSHPVTCPRCHMKVTPAMPTVQSGGHVLHRECYIAWHFSQTGRYPRRLRHVRSATAGGVE